MSAAPANSRKAESLRSTFLQMETAEIERRLAAGQLTPIAVSIAQEELDARKAVAAAPPAPLLHEIGSEESSLAVIAGIVVAALLMLGYAALFMKGSFVLVLLIVLTMLGAVIGKALPALGFVLGGALLASPVWLYFQFGDSLRWKWGDFKPLEALVSWFFLIMLSVFGIGIGASLLKGALHKGSWREFAQQVDDDRRESIDRMR